MSNYVNLLDVVYPVNSIFQSMSSASPASTIGGTWTQIKTFLYGSNSAKQTGGETTHTLTVDEMPTHTHNLHYTLSSTELGLPSNVGNWNCIDAKWGWILPDSPVTTTGGGKHTTTCHHTQPASSGIASRKSPRGDVACQAMSTSWTSFIQSALFTLQQVLSRQQKSLAGLGQQLTKQLISVPQEKMKYLYHHTEKTNIRLRLMKCHLILTFAHLPQTGVLEKLGLRNIINLVNMAGGIPIRLVQHNRTTIDHYQNLFGCIFAQPNIILGGVCING